MSRGITLAYKNAITQDTVRPFLAVDLLFDSPIYLWSGTHQKSIQPVVGQSTNDYIGVGDLLRMTDIDESLDLGASGVQFELSGISGTNLLTKALTEDYQGKEVIVYLGALNGSGLVSGIHEIFSGFMDNMIIIENPNNPIIQLKVENRLVALTRTKIRRYTSQDQRGEHPLDQGFDFVTNIAEKDIVWGESTEKAAGQQYEPPARR